MAIVTGAGTGTGKATALRFAKAGARVVAVDIKGEGVQKAVSEIKQHAGDAPSMQADISLDQQARLITDEATRAYGKVAILVNNAATLVLKGFSATVTEWQQSLGDSVVGTVMVNKHVIKAMKRNGRGTIMKRLGQPSEVAQAVLFLASEEASYINGTSLMVDGGYTVI